MVGAVRIADDKVRVGNPALTVALSADLLVASGLCRLPRFCTQGSAETLPVLPRLHLLVVVVPLPAGSVLLGLAGTRIVVAQRNQLQLHVVGLSKIHVNS